ncbi:MAG: DNA polymerase III subunit delta', partial [Polaribacter sp.]
MPHAQLFVGKEGTGTLPMAIAYAQYILMKFSINSEACRVKCEKLQHPDLHFAFPVATTDNVKNHPVSDLFLEEWREFVATNSYGSLFNWMQHIGVEKKQGLIGKDEAQQISKKLTLKSYEGGFKIMIIWNADKMNETASNKLLKLIEEPPEKTILLLITENEEQIIKTITSRCQAIHFNRLGEEVIEKSLIENEQIEQNQAKQIAYQSEGNYNKALHLADNNSKDLIFEEWFVTWVRSAFKARGNASVIQDLIDWSNAIAGEGREVQKQFLQYCLQVFRQALLLNYGSPDLVFLQPQTAGFKLENFAPFVHSANILAIEKEISDAQFHIER